MGLSRPEIRSVSPNQKTLDEREQQIQDTFAIIPLDLYKKNDKSVSSRLQQCVQNAADQVEI